MTDSPDGGPLTPPALSLNITDVPRTLSAYGEGYPLPPMTTQADHDAFEAEQYRGCQERD